MAAAAQKKQFALDTNLLIDLAEDKDFAHTFREAFLEKGYELRVTPTVIQELTFAVVRKTEDEQKIARKALNCMCLWGIRPFDLMPVGRAITERFTRRLIERNLLPESEVNDGQILAEASLAGIPILVTSDHHLLNIDEAELLTAFNDSDLKSVRPLHPKNLLKAIR